MKFKPRNLFAKTAFCFVLISGLVYFINTCFLFAQIENNIIWDNRISAVQLVDTAQILNEKNQIINNSHLNSFRSSNSVNKILQTINTPDSVIISGTNITQSENSVFISPINSDVILNSNNSSDWDPLTEFFGTSGFASSDGGLTWPVGSTAGVGGTNRGDPAAVIDLNGIFYVGYITPNRGQGIAYSDNNGQTWTHKQITDPQNAHALLDKNHLWVDNIATSPFAGRLYTAFTIIDIDLDKEPVVANEGEIVLLYSANQGISWDWATTGAIISFGVAASFNHGVNIQTGPNGEVYACWAIYDSWPANENSIGFARSLDGGVNWEPAKRIHTITGHRFTSLAGGKTMRRNSFPVMTVNQQNGDIYVVWTQYSNNPDIAIIKSSDQGDNWSPGANVNQNAGINDSDQWFPWIACDEVTGALVVIYYDSRNFAGNDQAETFVSISYDGGDTWEDFLISDVSWSGDGIAGFVNNYAGDYLGIDVSHGKVVPVWSDNRTGNMLAYTQPFYLPCPQDLELCNATITGDAVYKVANTITVGGPGCNYTVTSTGNVVMEAGTEIIFTGDVEITGNFIATINPACSSFGDAKLADTGPANINVTKDEPVTKIEYKKRDPEIDKYYFTKFYPNPADNFTNIEYILTNNSDVNITIYNSSGNLIGKIVSNTNQPKGKYQIRFDASNLANGLYFCTITTNDYTASHKFSVVK